MLIVKYFLVVGAALTVGLIALNAHLTATTVAPATVRAATPPAPPPPAVAAQEPATAATAPPAAPAKTASHGRRSKSSKRHSHVTFR
jgi:hypothetical protein